MLLPLLSYVCAVVSGFGIHGICLVCYVSEGLERVRCCYIYGGVRAYGVVTIRREEGVERARGCNCRFRNLRKLPFSLRGKDLSSNGFWYRKQWGLVPKRELVGGAMAELPFWSVATTNSLRCRR